MNSPPEICQEHRRTRQGAGGQLTDLPNSGKTVGGNSGKARRKKSCVKFRPNQPLCPLNHRVPIYAHGQETDIGE